MSHIAWQHLPDLARAQLLHFRPDLQFEHDVAMGVLPRCQRCSCGGNIFYDDGEFKCLLCGRLFDKHGNEIKPEVRHKNLTGGGFHHPKK